MTIPPCTVMVIAVRGTPWTIARICVLPPESADTVKVALVCPSGTVMNGVAVAMLTLSLAKSIRRPPAGAGSPICALTSRVSPAGMTSDAGRTTVTADTTVSVMVAGALRLFDRSIAVARTVIVVPGTADAGTGIEKTSDALPLGGVTCFASVKTTAPSVTRSTRVSAIPSSAVATTFTFCPGAALK